MDFKKIGEKMKYLRAKNDLSMEKLANILNAEYETKISKSMVSSWENAKYTPSMSNLSAYSNYFNVPLSYFLDDDVEPSEETAIKKIIENPYKLIEGANFNKNWKNKIVRNEIADDIFLIQEKLNLLGLIKLLEYAKDLEAIQEYVSNKKD